MAAVDATAVSPEELQAKAWEGFAEGNWQKDIDVRDFIQKNYTPYEGDESFLADATEKTKHLWQYLDDNNDAGLTNDGDEILFMAFPSEKATDTKLCGGIWGFGVFDNGDANKIEASKLFIKYMADSAEGTPDAVLSSTYFPVRDTVEGKDLTGLYGDVQTMSDYSTLMQYLGDYYQVTPGWAEARTAWWNMLQQVGSGADVQTAVDEFVGTANAAAGN